MFVHSRQEAVDWGILAGYDEQKRQIEDTLLLALLHPGAGLAACGQGETCRDSVCWALQPQTCGVPRSDLFGAGKPSLLPPAAEVYNEIAKGTRRQFAPNRPRAVLFEGCAAGCAAAKWCCARLNAPTLRLVLAPDSAATRGVVDGVKL